MQHSARHLAACGAGLALGGAAFALVPGSARVLAAAVLGLAGALALWPIPAGRGAREATGRADELEAEVARLAAALARRDEEVAQLRGALTAIHRLLESDGAAPAPLDVAAGGPGAESGRDRAIQEGHRGTERHHRARAAA